MSERYVCVHAHFYQPPRENPWLEAVELQDSASPFHDWNERITEQCYAPNGASRILDAEGRIVDIVNNYAHISYNVGPTLLAWLEQRRPEVYENVLAADRLSKERFGGHGSAMAQAYNHMILPLANGRDKRTQVKWGLADFRRRFGRDPEGMWLPETAVDLETLEILADHGIRFTVLAPSQASRVRRRGARTWRDVSGSRIDPSRAYQLRLRGGASAIALFFYDGPISRAVAFERLLDSGETFEARLLSAFDDARTWPQLAHIATDGETYGHHHAHGDMALAYALRQIEQRGEVRLTNYGEFLAGHPPTHEVEIIEDTAWSCVHGVGRWWTNCGCNTGRAGWDQEWRQPLRQALDYLRDSLVTAFEAGAGALLRDPWAARDAYIDVILDRSAATRGAFLLEQAARPLSAAEQTVVWKWLELQRQTMLMYTSCGWFFDDLSGIETVQVILYAGRALQLARDLGVGEDVEGRFLEQLAQARSNLPEQGDGRAIFERYVRPAIVDLPKVGAHYAITSLFDGYGERSRIYAYRVERQEQQLWSTGMARLAVGRVRVSSEVTEESEILSYAVLHLGDHNVHGAVRRAATDESHAQMREELREAFERGEHPQVIRIIDRHFPGETYSLKELFRDDQRRIIDEILHGTLEAAEASYRQVYDRHAPLMRFLRDIRIPQPEALLVSARFVLDAELRHALAADPLDLTRITALVREAESWGIELKSEELGFVLEQKIERLAERLAREPRAIDVLQELDSAAHVARELPFPADLWKAQNVYHDLRATAAEMNGHPGDAEWLEHYRTLGDALGVRPGP